MEKMDAQYTYYSRKGEVRISVHGKAIRRFMNKIRGITARSNGRKSKRSTATS